MRLRDLPHPTNPSSNLTLTPSSKASLKLGIPYSESLGVVHSVVHSIADDMVSDTDRDALQTALAEIAATLLAREEAIEGIPESEHRERDFKAHEDTSPPMADHEVLYTREALQKELQDQVIAYVQGAATDPTHTTTSEPDAVPVPATVPVPADEDTDTLQTELRAALRTQELLEARLPELERRATQAEQTAMTADRAVRLLTQRTLKDAAELDTPSGGKAVGSIEAILAILGAAVREGEWLATTLKQAGRDGAGAAMERVIREALQPHLGRPSAP